jgi:hypothetical protein
MNDPEIDHNDFVIKDGKLIGDWDSLYDNVSDPWNQSRKDHVTHTSRQIIILWCEKIRSLNEVNITLELGCGFGHLTGALTTRNFEAIGVDISTQAISSAKLLYPTGNFEVSNYNNGNLYEFYSPNIIIMSQLTWYILESLGEFLTYLKKYAQSIDESIFIIHSLAIYEDQIQKLGREKFTTHGQILEYMDSRISDLIFLESGEISTIQSDNLKSKNSYFIAQINP